MINTKNPVKAIRAYCLKCKDRYPTRVRECGYENCPLYPFRMGENPYRKKRELTEEQRNVAAERLAEARAIKYGKNWRC